MMRVGVCCAEGRMGLGGAVAGEGVRGVNEGSMETLQLQVTEACGLCGCRCHLDEGGWARSQMY
jgi:hypothetical protein